MSSVTKPILKDETFSAKMDALIAKFGTQTLTITCTSDDSTAVTNQNIKVYEASTMQVAADLTYNAPTSLTVTLPYGFSYLVVPTVTLANHFCEDKPSGLLLANTTVTLTYKSLGTLSTFTGLKAALDAGLGRHIPLGTEVSYTDTEFGTMTYECVDFDNETDTMTLLMKDTLPNQKMVDAPEATYYCSAALPVGNYTFKNGNTSYYFALTQEAPQDAQLRLLTNGFTVYTIKGGTTVGETGSVSTTALENPTDLGTTGAGALNHIERVNSGSNDYGESALRQYLNASGYNWWLPKTGFDRPPSYAGSKGFMTGIPAEVLAVIDTTEVLCASQNTYCAPDSTHTKNSRYTCNDKFFLASQMEMFGSSDFTDNSTLFDLFVGASNEDRIKRYNSSARNWWLRSPYSNAYDVRTVNPSGAVNYYSAYRTYGVAAACKISKSII